MTNRIQKMVQILMENFVVNFNKSGISEFTDCKIFHPDTVASQMVNLRFYQHLVIKQAINS